MIDFVYWALLVFSVLTNLVLAWYCRELVRQFYYLGNLTKQMKSMLREYKEHISTVFSKDMFFGDPTMESLVNHSKDVVRDLSTFMEVFDLVGDETNTTEKNEEKEKEG
jgi:hypothetical protein